MTDEHPAGGAWESCAAEASMLVFGARGRIYSHPFDDYSTVQSIASAIIPPSHRETVVGATLRMVAVKLARINYGLEQGFDPTILRDSFVDACGYLDCAYGVLVREYENAIETRGRLTGDTTEGDDR